MATEQLELARVSERNTTGKTTEHSFKSALDRVHFAGSLAGLGTFLAANGLALASDIFQNDALWNGAIWGAGAMGLSVIVSIATHPSFRKN